MVLRRIKDAWYDIIVMGLRRSRLGLALVEDLPPDLPAILLSLHISAQRQCFTHYFEPSDKKKTA